MSTLCPACGRTFDDAYRVCPFDGTGLVRLGEQRLEPGDVLDDRYLVSGPLGEGGTGLVYRAQDSFDGRDVVLKVIRAEHASSKEQVARFLSELKVGQRVDSPHVRPVLGTTRTPEGRLVLVLAYVEGRSLAEVLAAEAPLGEARALALARAIAEALVDVHAAGVVHRDLKPSNVLLTGLPPAETVTLLDLGVARQLDVPSDQLQTRTGHVVGTPAYLSPEAILGDPIDGRADLYALGVLLHELLTGRRPFEAPSLVKLMLKHLNDAPAPLTARVPVHPRTAELVSSLLAKDRSRRPVDARRTIEAIDATLAAARSDSATARRMATETLERPGVAPSPFGAGRQPSFSLEGLSLGAPLHDLHEPASLAPEAPRHVDPILYELHHPDARSEPGISDEARARLDDHLRARAELLEAERRGHQPNLGLTRAVGAAATLVALLAVAWLWLGGGRPGVVSLANEVTARWQGLQKTLDSWGTDQPDTRPLHRY